MTGSAYEDNPPVNRRKSLRIPVGLSVNIRVSDKASGFIKEAALLNYSSGGVGIQWDMCDPCTGYEPGGIAPDCVFSPFNGLVEGSRELDFHLELANFEQNIEFSGKAVYTLRESGIEKVGIVFTRISDEMLVFMSKVF
jgi:hypothetical protein